MMRALVLVLLVANLGYFAWAQGWLDGVTGSRATGDREPERLARQVNPDAVRLLSPNDAALSAAAPAPAACLEIGPFTPAELPAAEAAWQDLLPAGTTTSSRTETPAVLTVYLGPFPIREALTRRLEELARLQLRVPAREITSPTPLAPGISLGRFDDRATADRALAEFAQRGLRAARVVELSPARTAITVRVEQAGSDLQARLVALRDERLRGRRFAPCPASAADAASR